MARGHVSTLARRPDAPPGPASHLQPLQEQSGSILPAFVTLDSRHCRESLDGETQAAIASDSKGPQKSQVMVQHSKLLDANIVKKMKA